MARLAERVIEQIKHAVPLVRLVELHILEQRDRHSGRTRRSTGIGVHNHWKTHTLRKWRYHYKAKKPNKAKSFGSAFFKVNVRQARVSQELVVLCIGSNIRLECLASYDVACKM